jgi:thymidylate synthase
MTAVYRAHDYFGKALGNLVGLSRLLTFVGAQTNHEIGTLTCHSTYAFIDVTNKKADALLAKIR